MFFGPADSAQGAVVHRWERRALGVCARCAVVAGCLAWALEFPASEQYGVVGGMTAGQRRAALRVSGRWPVRSSGAGWTDPQAGARVEELARAAVALGAAGRRAGWIAARLGVGERRVRRWLARHRAGGPLNPPAGGRSAGVPA
ncbi:MAG: WhiB family transcriptional regulator [Egibacteraceae bacterium]